MSVTITRLYDDAAAKRAVRELGTASGRKDTIAASKAGHWATGDVIAAIGGAVVILVGLTLLAIPGVGAIVMGLIVGWLIQRAMDEKDVNVQSETVQRGGVLVTARVPDTDRDRLEAILDRSAVNRNDLRPAYRKAS